ncbi:MAG: histidinol-phosphatase [bacterium]|nr:MAG: histidinol-phosphatase [bacterium]
MNFRILKLILLYLFIISLLFTVSICFSQTNTRTEINIPDISGYITLKCDFHMHSVFSDGSVWPTVRVEEAWREGLDAISITDHIEYLSHKTDIPLTDHNRSYEIAKTRADELGLILIKGAEITRDMPPGHFNAIFLNDINPLDIEDWRDAFKAANEQGAFVFWNHPGWRQVDEIPIWYDEHTELFENKVFRGIEIVNHYSYYSKAFQWALDKKLTLIGNSDVHSPIHVTFDLAHGQHRPITLVFAKEKSEPAIKEALLARRTAVYFNKLLMGEEKFLKPIFKGSIEILNLNVSIKGSGRANIQIHNQSDLIFELVSEKEIEEVSIPEGIKLYPDRTMLFQIKGKSKSLSGKKKFSIPFVVENLLIDPDKGLPVTLDIEINFIPEP